MSESNMSEGPSAQHRRTVRFIDPFTQSVVSAEELETSHESLQPIRRTLSPIPTGLRLSPHRERKVLKGLEREFSHEQDISLVRHDREFVRKDVVTRIKRGIIRKEYHLHLFTDAIAYSEPSPSGLRLHHILPLADCTAATLVEEKSKGAQSKNTAFKIVCGTRELVFECETIKQMMSWVIDIKMFKSRALKGLMRKPQEWSQDGSTKQFSNKKLTNLKARKLNRASHLAQILSSYGDDELDKWEEEEDEMDLDQVCEEETGLGADSGNDAAESPVDPPVESQILQTSSPPPKKLVLQENDSASPPEWYQQRPTSCMKKDRGLQCQIVSKDVFKAMQLERMRQDIQNSMLQERLKIGSYLIKYNYRKKQRRKYYCVSQDGSMLQWGARKGSYTNSVLLAQVTRIELGPFSERFEYYRWEKGHGRPWLCFTIHLFDPKRTIDIECESDEQLKTWFLGLQSLVPTWKAFFMSRGELCWTLLHMKLDQEAISLGKSRAETLFQYTSAEVPLPCNSDTDDDFAFDKRIRSTSLHNVYKILKRKASGHKSDAQVIAE